MSKTNPGASHTPGPWFLHVSQNVIQISDKQFHTNKVAIVHWMGFDSCDKPRDIKIANARLMAAAPDLLAALLEVAPFIQASYHSDHPTVRVLEAAIKKATEG